MNVSIFVFHFDTKNSASAFSETGAAGHVNVKWGDWEGS